MPFTADQRHQEPASPLRDLCRQLVLLLGILHRRLSPEEKDQMRAVLPDLSDGRQTFEEAG